MTLISIILLGMLHSFLDYHFCLHIKGAQIAMFPLNSAIQNCSDFQGRDSISYYSLLFLYNSETGKWSKMDLNSLCIHCRQTDVVSYLLLLEYYWIPEQIHHTGRKSKQPCEETNGEGWRPMTIAQSELLVDGNYQCTSLLSD